MLLDWQIAGHVTGPLAAFRDKHRMTPEKREWAEITGKMDEAEQAILCVELSLVTKAAAELDSVMQGVAKQIEAHRTGAYLNSN